LKEKYMVDPIMALLLAVIVFVGAYLLFWPEKGLIARLRWSKDNRTRILMEDALKHIYKCEEDNTTCTYHSLSSVMSRAIQQINPVLKRLKSLGLLTISGQGFQLTSEGRNYALRIVRLHRLWERYLSEETSIPETDWHEQAEIKEHLFTEEEANRISKQLGYPRYDPHGDPIPTASGDLPPHRGRAIREFSNGDTVQVIQIEDEPPAVYAEIIEMGIYLGVYIEILKKLKNKIHFLVEGKVHSLTEEMSNNIFVQIAAEEQKVEESPIFLSSLKTGEEAEVTGISRACRGPQRRRLMDLGIVPGTLISMAMTSAGGDPRAYYVRGAMIALRDDQADFIHIRAAGNGNNNISEKKKTTEIIEKI
jgi:DtxR family Mn-dependent transcriptional regulator